MMEVVLLTTDPRTAPPPALDVPMRSVDDLEQLEGADAFLLHPVASVDPATVLERVRQHPRPGVYLKPVILLEDGEAPGLLEEAVDGTWDPGRNPEPPPGLEAVVDRIRRSTESFDDGDQEGETSLPLRLLRLIASRGLVATPRATAAHPAGFVYPPLEPFLADASGQIGSILASLESRAVLEGSFVARAYACAHCGCAFLNFQEVCPDCGSANLTSHDNVHHFRCGHLAPLPDFIDGDDLVCPKCDRKLKQIGVDYDKPSMAYHCGECHLRSSDVEVTTTCYRCRRTTTPELQLHRTIRSYRITTYGENAARYGLVSRLEEALGREVHLFDFEPFVELVEIEASRIDRYERSQSSLLVVRFEGIERVYGELGQRSDELFLEITKAFVGILRDSDVLTARNESLFVMLLTETPVQGAERALQRLREGVQGILETNLRNPPTLLGRVAPVELGIDVEAVVARTSEEAAASAEAEAE